MATTIPQQPVATTIPQQPKPSLAAAAVATATAVPGLQQVTPDR
jgi:hypothetical protein